MFVPYCLRSPSIWKVESPFSAVIALVSSNVNIILNPGDGTGKVLMQVALRQLLKNIMAQLGAFGYNTAGSRIRRSTKVATNKIVFIYLVNLYVGFSAEHCFIIAIAYKTVLFLYQPTIIDPIGVLMGTTLGMVIADGIHHYWSNFVPKDSTTEDQVVFSE